MKIKVLSLLVLMPFLVEARKPLKKDAQYINMSLDLIVSDGVVYMGTPSITINSKFVECHCGKRALSIAIEKGKVVGLCLEHETYNAVNPAHPDNWCVSCGSKAKSPNIADKKTK